MRTLKIGFSRPRSKWAIGSWIIRWFEGCNFSHAFVRWTSNSLSRDLVYEASHGMVHFVSGSRFDDAAETVQEYSFDISDEQYTRVMQKCVDMAGVKYGTWQLIGMALERITGLRNPFRDGDATYVCSELAGEIVEIMGMKLNLDLELVGPRKLAEALAALKEK